MSGPCFHFFHLLDAVRPTRFGISVKSCSTEPSIQPAASETRLPCAVAKQTRVGAPGRFPARSMLEVVHAQVGSDAQILRRRPHLPETPRCRRWRQSAAFDHPSANGSLSRSIKDVPTRSASARLIGLIQNHAKTRRRPFAPLCRIGERGRRTLAHSFQQLSPT